MPHVESAIAPIFPRFSAPARTASGLALGGAKIINSFTKAAALAGRPFIAAPVWNENGAITNDGTQYLCFTLRGAGQTRVIFTTSEIERYGNRDTAAVSRIEAQLNELLQQSVQAGFGSSATGIPRPSYQGTLSTL